MKNLTIEKIAYSYNAIAKQSKQIVDAIENYASSNKKEYQLTDRVIENRFVQLEYSTTIEDYYFRGVIYDICTSRGFKHVEKEQTNGRILETFTCDI